MNKKEDAKLIKEIIELVNKIKNKSKYYEDNYKYNPITDHFLLKLEDERRYMPEFDEYVCYSCTKSDKCTEQDIGNTVSNYFNNLKSSFDNLIKSFPEEPLFYIERAKLNLSYLTCKYKSPEEKYNLYLNVIKNYSRALICMDNPSKEFIFEKIILESKLKYFNEITSDYTVLKSLYKLDFKDYIWLTELCIYNYDNFFKDYETMILNEYNKNKCINEYMAFSDFIKLCLYRKDYKKTVEWADKYIKASLLYFDELYNIDRDSILFSEDNYNISVKGLNPNVKSEDKNTDIILFELSSVFMYRAVAKQNLKLYDEALKDYMNYYNLHDIYLIYNRSAINELFRLYKNSENKKEKILEEIIKIRDEVIFGKSDLKKLKEYKIGIFWLSEDESKIVTANIKTAEDILNQYKTDAPDIFYPELSYEKAWQALDKEEIIKAGDNPDKNGWKFLKRGYVAYDFIKEEFIFAGGKWLTNKLILTKLADIFGMEVDYNDFPYVTDIEYRIEHIPEFA